METNKLRAEFLKEENTSFLNIPINGVYFSYILWLEKKIFEQESKSNIKEFYLDETQLKKLNDWKENIKKEHGEYGLFDYIFTPLGIGLGVKVKSHLTNEIICLSEVNKW